MFKIYEKVLPFLIIGIFVLFFFIMSEIVKNQSHNVTKETNFSTDVLPKMGQ
jgi:hypothetical protein